MSADTNSGGGGITIAVLATVALASVACGVVEITPTTAPQGGAASNVATMPADHASAYRTAASTAPEGCAVDAALLAAIGWQETHWGTWGVGPDGLIVGAVGEQGPMQFTAATWSDFGHGSPHNIHDAAGAATRLLCSAGGSERNMLWRYNQSGEYGTAVAGKAAELRGARWA